MSHPKDVGVDIRIRIGQDVMEVCHMVLVGIPRSTGQPTRLELGSGRTDTVAPEGSWAAQAGQAQMLPQRKTIVGGHMNEPSEGN
jgi:hypothetical protein